jgi:hypothetical protein
MITGAILNDGQRIELCAANEAEAAAYVANNYPGRKAVSWVHGSIRAKNGLGGVKRYVEEMGR